MFQMIKTAYADGKEKATTAKKNTVSFGKKALKMIWYGYIMGITIFVVLVALLIAATGSFPQVIWSITNQKVAAAKMNDFNKTVEASLDQNQSK